LLAAGLFAGCRAQSDSQPESGPVQSAVSAVSEPAGPPETASAPLTGLPLSDGQTKNQRPVAVMVGNSEIALPQSGTAGADVIYEMVTEGGITRLMAVFSGVPAVGRVGSVRSIRDQFVQQLLPLNAVGVHIGESIYASEMLRQYAYPTVNGFYLGTLAFQFDEARDAVKPNVHCWYTDASLIAQGMSLNEMPSDTGTADTLFKFLRPEEAPRVPAQQEALSVAFRFSGATDALFTYDPQNKVYLKSEFSAPQLDEATGTQLAFTNVLVLATQVTLKPDGDCTEFDFTSGKGWYFSNGWAEEITWKKGDPDQILKVYGQDGKELSVNCGKSYIAFVDTGALQNSLTITGPQPPAEVPAE
ncbi:MAG: DUF3048 domain-containing protein, partial [Oscillospiraceae bacterium]|nr:DUF3048 domain-containing protein [Oscillospiraceae bacterium]